MSQTYHNIFNLISNDRHVSKITLDGAEMDYCNKINGSFVRTIEIIGASSGVEKIVQHQDGVEVFLNKDVWGKKVFFLVESLKGTSFRFLEGGCGFFINTPFDDNFILILNKICAKLQCEK